MRRIWKFLCTHPGSLAVAAVPLLGALTMFHG